MFDGNDHPSDIDMFYLCKDNTLIIAEIKSERGFFAGGQRSLITKIINAHNGDAIGLYVTHDKLVQNGDKVVDVSICPVKELYMKCEAEWRVPKHEITVKDVLDFYKKRSAERMPNIF